MVLFISVHLPLGVSSCLRSLSCRYWAAAGGRSRTCRSRTRLRPPTILSPPLYNTAAFTILLFKKMLKPRSKSVDLQLDPEHILTYQSWKRNLLCGVFTEEMTSSIFYTREASEDRYVVKREGSVREELKDISEETNLKRTLENGRITWHCKLNLEPS